MKPRYPTESRLPARLRGAGAAVLGGLLALPVMGSAQAEFAERPARPAWVATGVVPRVLPAENTQVLVIVAEHAGNPVPFYARLAAEVTDSYVDRGRGQLYIGFHLDPVYRVHWNNRVAPLRFEITAPEGVVIRPASAQAPEVEVTADADPREFLLDIEGYSPRPLSLVTHYSACDDAHTFCIAIRQRYDVYLEIDPDTLTVLEPFGLPGTERTAAAAASDDGKGEVRMVGPLERLQSFDTNRDGKVSREEAPPLIEHRFDLIDRNRDGVLDNHELELLGRSTREPSGPP